MRRSRPQPAVAAALECVCTNYALRRVVQVHVASYWWTGQKKLFVATEWELRSILPNSQLGLLSAFPSKLISDVTMIKINTRNTA